MKVKTGKYSLRSVVINVVMAGGLLCLLSWLFFYVVLPFVTNKGKDVVVPDLKGLSFQEATSVLTEAELTFEVTDSAFDAEQPALTVLEQYPNAKSKVKINRRINLKVNSINPPTVPFPDLTGSTFDFARGQLNLLGLKIGRIQYRPDIANNTVLEATLAGSKIQPGQPIHKGSSIDLMVGVSTEKFPLPDLSGMSYDEAENYLLGMNLTVKAVYDAEGEQGKSNKIHRQYPLPGDTVKQGDGVELWVYR